jgi:hypothetical protein
VKNPIPDIVKDVLAAAADSAAALRYGEVLVRFVVHDGRLDLVEKTVSEKVKTGGAK